MSSRRIAESRDSTGSADGGWPEGVSLIEGRQNRYRCPHGTQYRRGRGERHAATEGVTPLRQDRNFRRPGLLLLNHKPVALLALVVDERELEARAVDVDDRGARLVERNVERG